MTFFLLKFTTNFLDLILVSFLELKNIVETGSDLLVSKQKKFLVSLSSFPAFLFNPTPNSYRTIILVNGLKSCLINMGYYINNIFRSYYSILRSISIKKAYEAAQYSFNSSIMKAKANIVNIQIKRYSCHNMLCLKTSALIKNLRNILQLPLKKFLKFSRQLIDYQSLLLSATPLALVQQVAAMAQQGYSISAMHSQGIAYEAIYDGLDYARQNEFITEVVYCKLQDQFNNTVIVYTILIVVAIGVGLYYLVKKWRPPEEPSEPSGPSTMPSLSSSPSGDSLSLSLGRGNGSQCVYVILLTLTMLISLKLFTYIECSQYLFIIPTFGKDIWATTFNKEAFQSYSVPPLQLEVQKRLFISLEIKDILFITKKHINKHASYVQK